MSRPTRDPDFTAILEKRHGCPHSFLGLHPHSEKRQIIRLYRPGASEIYLEVDGKTRKTRCVDKDGLFACIVSKKITNQDYKIYHQNGLLAHDPYSFQLPKCDTDLYLFRKGVHYELYNFLGAHKTVLDGVEGVRFAVWAPNAENVSLVGDFNHWDGRLYPMCNLEMSGIWTIFVPGINHGEKYKFEIFAKNKERLLKADPVGFYSERRPDNASIVTSVDNFKWEDKGWQDRRKKDNLSMPLNIYELHVGSWKKKEGNFFPNYREIARELADYCLEMHFSHVELLPVMEHPLDESWGYQVSGFYAVTSRWGSVEDFQYLVNYLHSKGIGVILDWVPAHFPTDEFALSSFDGTALYEHADPRQGFHPHWNTKIFNYGRKEVANFLLSSALFWFDKMHIDGLRVDAVASMLYLDYGRKEGEWIPNIYGSNFNLEAIEFLKHLNSIVHQRFPTSLMIAEESSSFKGVSHRLEEDGLGFDLKWSMGWMNDTLRYFKKDSIYRSYQHNDLTFGLLYAFSERFILVLSHDEVVHGKGSLLGKMPGDEWQRFANLRLLYSYMMCQPGKKLFFMGGEIGQYNEWNCKDQINWDLLKYPFHSGVQCLVKELNAFYHRCDAFWQDDFSYKGFEWVDFSDRDNSVVSYLRKGKHAYIFCVHNFTPTYHSSYVIGLKGAASVKEVFNSDHERYGGSNKVDKPIVLKKDSSGKSESLTISLPPLATIIFDVQF